MRPVLEAHRTATHRFVNPHPTNQALHMNTALRASVLTWIGHGIHNPRGEKLGELGDIVFDTATGEIIYGVLKVGGVLGMGEKLFAVPWRSLHVQGTRDDWHLLLNASVERLKSAPGFDRENWPDDADQGFVERTHTTYS